MPLLVIARLLASLLSLAVLVGAGYFIWSWFDGEAVYIGERVERVREDWRLWVGLALLAFSFVGRFLLAPLLGRADTEKTRLSLERGDGELVDMPTGASLYIEQHGDRSKPTMLFTHGWGLDSTIWEYAKRDFADEFHVVVWDLPGLGKSKPGADARFDPARLSNDLLGVMDFIGKKDIILVGHSIGGMTIQSLVHTQPERVRRDVVGIVLLNTTFTNPIKTVAASGLFEVLRWPVLEPALFLTRILQPLAWLEAWTGYLSGLAHVANRTHFGRAVTRSQLNAVTLLGTRNSQGVIARGNLGMLRWDASGAMATYGGPVLVISGWGDLATKVEASRTIASNTRRAELIEMDRVNHNGFLENHEAYKHAILEFARAATDADESAGPTARRTAS